jgi:hypothetical protein
VENYQYSNEQLALYLTISVRYCWLAPIKYHDPFGFIRLSDVYSLLHDIEREVSRRASDAFLIANLVDYIAHTGPKPAIAFAASGRKAIQLWRDELEANGLTAAAFDAILASAPPKVNAWAKRSRLTQDRVAAIAEANGLAAKKARFAATASGGQ